MKTNNTSNNNEKALKIAACQYLHTVAGSDGIHEMEPVELQEAIDDLNFEPLDLYCGTEKEALMCEINHLTRTIKEEYESWLTTNLQ